jgi:phenylpropionate dioxygenase-like ring-hydroxylating dioxygenase large terminal subunit
MFLRLSFGRSLTPPSADAPPAVFSKTLGHEQARTPSPPPLPQSRWNGKSSGMVMHLKSVQPTPDPLDDMSLPGWLYFDPEFLEAEKKAFLRAAPQVVCHLSEIPNAGEWRTLEYLGESVVVIRGDDGQVRAFSNVCRHRGSRIVDGEGGCAKVLTCPYHAWSYSRDGRLVGVPHRSEYPGLQTERLGLFPVALETWRGFLFVILEPGAPSVAEMMAAYDDEVAPYRFEDLRAIGRVTLRPRALNWKTACTFRSAILA